MCRAALRWALLMAIVAAAGCGGTGSGLEQPASKTLDVYVTGDPGKRYSHVWVTIQKVELTNGLTQTPVFNEALHGGLKVDLATLTDRSGPLYLYLGSKTYEVGLFSSAKVSLGNEVTLEPTNHSVARTLKLAATKDAFTVMDVDLTKASKLVPGTNLVLNLDNSVWKENTGLLSAPKGKLVTMVEGAGLMDASRHLKQTLTGTIANLDNGDKQKAFSLTNPTGQIEVRTMASQAKPEGSEPALILFEGLPVRVTGTFDPASGVFNASLVEKEAPTSVPKPSALTAKASAGPKR